MLNSSYFTKTGQENPNNKKKIPCQVHEMCLEPEVFYCLLVLAVVLLVMAAYSLGEEVRLISPVFAFLPVKNTSTVHIFLPAYSHNYLTNLNNSCLGLQRKTNKNLFTADFLCNLYWKIVRHFSKTRKINCCQMSLFVHFPCLSPEVPVHC